MIDEKPEGIDADDTIHGVQKEDVAAEVQEQIMGEMPGKHHAIQLAIAEEVEAYVSKVKDAAGEDLVNAVLVNMNFNQFGRRVAGTAPHLQAEHDQVSVDAMNLIAKLLDMPPDSDKYQRFLSIRADFNAKFSEIVSRYARGG